MTRVLVLWEDKFYQKLDVCLRRTLRSLPNTGTNTLEITPFGVQGNGGFDPFLRNDWPIAARKGFLRSHGPIEQLICIADADCATSVCGIEQPPGFPNPTDAWVTRANDTWTAKLRSIAPLAADRVHGRFLRWSLESLLIALHDVDSALRKLACRNRDALTKFLQSCNPPPAEVVSGQFVERFRAPQYCLDQMLKAAGATRSGKGSVPREDALDEGSRVALDRLVTRVPDILSIAQFVQKLAQP